LLLNRLHYVDLELSKFKPVHLFFHFKRSEKFHFEILCSAKNPLRNKKNRLQAVFQKAERPSTAWMF